MGAYFLYVTFGATLKAGQKKDKQDCGFICFRGPKAGAGIYSSIFLAHD